MVLFELITTLCPLLAVCSVQPVIVGDFMLTESIYVLFIYDGNSTGSGIVGVQVIAEYDIGTLRLIVSQLKAIYCQLFHFILNVGFHQDTHKKKPTPAL